MIKGIWWVLVAVLLAGCGGGGDDPASPQPTEYTVAEGVAQKGPLLRGSWISINELSPTTLQPSGGSFSFEVADNFGTFKPAATIFTKQYLESTALGYFLDELTGKPSADVVILRSLTNLSTDRAVNINVLTDLANARVRSQVTRTTSPVTFSIARATAQRDVLRPFFIYNGRDLMPGGTTQPASFGELDLSKNRNADQVLAAISAVVTQIGKTGGGINQFINQFEADLADDGVLNNSPRFAVAPASQINAAVKAVDWSKVASNLNTFYRTTRYRAADLGQWIDTSGGVDRVIERFKFAVTEAPVGAESRSPEYVAGSEDAAQCFSVNVGKLYRNGVPVTGIVKAAMGDKFQIGLITSTGGVAATAFAQRSAPASGVCPTTMPTTGVTRTMKWTVTSASFTAHTGRLALGRAMHTATLLRNGKMLITGGVIERASPTSPVLNSAEIYDPATGNAVLLANTMRSPRGQHQATLLPDGRVLITGGQVDNLDGDGSNTAELYDPATQTFTALAATMTSLRGAHGATLLADGKVLISGGFANNPGTDTAELFDPSTGRFTALTARLNGLRDSHSATLLPNGKVLLAAGLAGSVVVDTAELYDPVAQNFTPLASRLRGLRGLHAATLLADGRVLISGGGTAFGPTSVVLLDTAELFDPASGNFSTVPATMTARRAGHAQVLLADGTVLLIGGGTSSVAGPSATFDVVDTMEIFRH